MENDATTRGNSKALAAIALAAFAVHLYVNPQLGFHRDELATLDDARHLAWGFVAYPPVAPFFARIALTLFGTSLIGFRVFSALTNAISIFVTGLMARELGGGRRAQLMAAAAAVPFSLASGAVMQYVAFDYLAWVLVAYCTLRLLRSRDPRWWVGVGCAIGFGMMAKYGMVFFVAGLAVGILATDARRLLLSRWLLLGVAASLVIFLPNLLWQWRHDFISLRFLQDIHERDIRWGRTKDFLPDQLKLTLLAAPLWFAGLSRYLFAREWRQFRALGLMYVAPLIIFIVAKGRGYYLAAAYPMLYAAGAVWFEQWTEAPRWRPYKRFVVIGWLALLTDIVLVGAICLPVMPVNSSWWKFAASQNGDLVEEVGWPDMVAEIAEIRDALPPQERAHLGIMAANYGEAGAINLYGADYGLPQAISGINSFWERGYGDPPPQTLIVLGHSQGFRERRFSACELAGRNPAPFGVLNEETRDHPEIYVCRGLRMSWPEFWKDYRYFG